ncbi:MAG: copper resistance protein CopC [Chloroflexota bacterium]|nr:copper resistance protein CopC [Chloroflexota bacterium]
MMQTSSRPQSVRRAALALTCLLWLASAGAAAAHSDLVSSDPAAGSTIGPLRDTPITLIFSETLKAGSKADIIGPAGKIGTATIDRYDSTRLVFTPTAPLAPGAWRMEWTSIATDGDVLRGTILFTVAVVATASPSPTTSPAATTSPTPSPSPAPSHVNSTSSDVLVPMIAAVLAIVVLGLVLLRSRRASVRR